MILHVTTASEWTKQEAHLWFVPNSLEREGFIHACTQEQLRGVLERYFTGKTQLLLMRIDETKLSATIKFERGATNEMFPHIFGPIERNAIISVVAIL